MKNFSKILSTDKILWITRHVAVAGQLSGQDRRVYQFSLLHTNEFGPCTYVASISHADNINKIQKRLPMYVHTPRTLLIVKTCKHHAFRVQITPKVSRPDVDRPNFHFMVKLISTCRSLLPRWILELMLESCCEFSPRLLSGYEQTMES